MAKTIFEKSSPLNRAYSLPKDAAAFSKYHPSKELLRKENLPLPEISELDIMRHYSLLAQKNCGIDTTFYPLGSCTMKLNPRVSELVSSFEAFQKTHPYAPFDQVQGNLEMIAELSDLLCKICGMQAATLVPNAGAQGEFVGVRLIQTYHEKRGEIHRNEMIIPDNAHGTNPATAAMCGYKILSIDTNADGDINLKHLKELVSEKTAGLMLTNPNTLGLFSPIIQDVSSVIHDAGGLLYYDGANLNAIMNISKPGDMGFDVMHLNLHKTFSTPHGGGGPGSGPVLCNSKLKKYLPTPYVKNAQGKFQIVWESKDSIGRIASFHGNFGIYLRAYLYIKLHGMYGLRKIAENAVINANFLKKSCEKFFTVPYKRHCMHEFVVQADRFLSQKIKAKDIAKRMLDYNIYAPTIYFPLIVKECMLIEPTETESLATLKEFIDILETICNEAENTPDLVRSAPHTTPIKRLDEVKAAKEPILKRTTDDKNTIYS